MNRLIVDRDPTLQSTLQVDPFSYFGVKFFSAYDRVKKVQGRMSEYEWSIIQHLADEFERMDPGAKNISREKTVNNPGRPFGTRIIGGRQAKP